MVDDYSCSVMAAMTGRQSKRDPRNSVPCDNLSQRCPVSRCPGLSPLMFSGVKVMQAAGPIVVILLVTRIFGRSISSGRKVRHTPCTTPTPVASLSNSLRKPWCLLLSCSPSVPSRDSSKLCTRSLLPKSLPYFQLGYAAWNGRLRWYPSRSG